MPKYSVRFSLSTTPDLIADSLDKAHDFILERMPEGRWWTDTHQRGEQKILEYKFGGWTFATIVIEESA